MLNSSIATGDIDQGLRTYMIGIYNRMSIGLVITGLVAFIMSSVPELSQLYQTWLVWPMILAPLALVFFMSFKLDSLNASTLKTLFYTYSALMGMSLGVLFMVYTSASIFQAGFVTAATFAAMSLYGYTTKRDLTSIGGFLIMGLIGIIIAGLVNIFLASSLMAFIINVAAVLIFVGLTAYDTQKLKEMYEVADDKTMTMGALTLYMDAVNLFINILQLIGVKKE
jgi:FtsH-binding integral membrane protein